MRILIFSFTGLAIIIAAAVVWWTGRNPDAERAAIEARRVESISRIGIRRMLSENSSFPILDIALGQWLDDGSRDFRGFLQRDGNAFQAYGRVRSICDTGVEKPACWEIAYLEANGREIDTTGSGSVPKPGPDEEPTNSEQSQPKPTNMKSDQSQSDGESTTEIAALPDTSPTEEPAQADVSIELEEAAETQQSEPNQAAAETQQSEPNQAAAGPSSTHKVVPSRANARKGPGLDRQVITVLTKGTELALLGIDSGWGDFLVMQGKNEGTRAWIALSIVSEIPPQ